MGRIKTTKTKSITKKLMVDHGEKFGEDFEQNKRIVEEVTTVQSKKLRNIIAGYATRLAKNREAL